MYNLVSGIIQLMLLFLGLATNFPYLTDIYGAAVLLPGFAVTFRRLHDTGRSAKWLWIVLIPIVGSIVIFVFTCLDSQPGPNKYGPNPKQPEPMAQGAYGY